MITRIEINGFKSFNNFFIEFAPFTLVAGTNASGKSNLFDAMKLMSALAATDLRSALAQQGQRGEQQELFSHYSNGQYADKMSFAVEMLVSRHIEDDWGGAAEINTPRMRYEVALSLCEDANGMMQLHVEHEELRKIISDKDRWAKRYFKHNKDIWKTKKAGGSSNPYIATTTENGRTTIKIRQDGGQGGRSKAANVINQTVLSGVNSVDFPHAFAAKQEITRWKYMQLNPEILREPTRFDSGLSDTVEYNGANLAGVMYRMKMEDDYLITQLSNKLCSFLPEYKAVRVEKDDTHKMFVVKLTNKQGVDFSSRVLSEGTLRLLALCVMRYNPQHQSLLCFEEPENGVHPFRIKQIIDLLYDMRPDFSDGTTPLLRQVIINTHSVGVLSYVNSMNGAANSDIEMLYSRSIPQVLDIKGAKVGFNATRMIPVEPQGDICTELGISEPERKISFFEAKSFMESNLPQ